MDKSTNTAKLLILSVSIISVLFAVLLYTKALPFSVQTSSLLMLLTLIITATLNLAYLFLFSKKGETSGINEGMNIFDSIAEAVLVFNENGSFEYANQSALKILRKDIDSVQGKSYTEVLPLFSDTGDSIYIGADKDPINKALQSGQQQQLKNLQLYFKDETVYLNVSVSPYEDPNTHKKRVVVLMQDITEEQALEKMKLDFVAMAAHELRTPMTSIRGYLELLINETEYYLQPVHRKFLEHALLASDRLVNLMSNLLSVSQIERHKVKLNLMPVDINDIIEKTMTSFRPDAKEKNLKFAYIRPPGDVPRVKGDPKYIRQIIDNLVSNAISYTAKGSVTVSLHYQPGGHQVTISVKDTGQGIPVEALPHMFEKFYRVSSLLEQGSKGTGLGLYIAKKLIEMQGGRIWVESVEGKGTVFSFALPTYREGDDKKS